MPASTAPAPTLVFVYGTLKAGGPWNHLLKAARFVGPAETVRPMPLVLGKVPYLLDQEGGHRVRGEVYEVDARTLGALDALEGHPEWYQRRLKAVRVMGEDQPRQAYAYVLTEGCYAHVDWRTLDAVAEYPIASSVWD